MKRIVFPVALCSFALILFLCLLVPLAHAKIYIDITAPALKKLPIAIYDFQGPSGGEIAEIIREDLIFTGIFMYIDKAGYIESAAAPFQAKNWTPLGIEAVVKGTVRGDRDLTAEVAVYDTFEGREILKKQYRGEKNSPRDLAHAIANDIYKTFTGVDGVFQTRIAFVGEDEGAKGIYLMDWDGERVRKLGLRGNLVLKPHWSADGSRIVYSSERGRQWGIYLLDFQKMAEQRIFASKGTNIAGSFFPRGDSITFSSSKDGTSDIYALSLKDSSVRKILSSYGIEVSPSVSPDGTLIAFVSDRSGSPQIYTMRTDGTDVRRVTFEGSYNTSPAWSPKSDRIVFSCRRGKNQVCLIKPDGSELMQLTDRGNNEDPSFSPDGRHITFSSDRDGRRGVFVMRANGELQKRVSPRGLDSFSPQWSPNERTKEGK